MEFLGFLTPYYYFIYWFVALLMTVNQFNKLSRYKGYESISHNYDYKPILLFLTFLTVFLGLRPINGSHSFADTAVYADTYDFLVRTGAFNVYGDDEIGSDWLFYSIQKFCAGAGVDVHVWLLLMAVCFMVPLYEGCKKLDSRHGALILLSCVGSFIFFNSIVNGVRNAIALNLVLLALVYLYNKRFLWVTLLSISGLGFHASAALPIAAMLYTYFVRKPKFMIITWLAAIAISLTFGSYFESLLVMMNFDQRLADNLEGDAWGDLNPRFRWDFLLYSAMPIVLACYTIFKRKLFNDAYLLLLGTYIYANSVWVLAIRALFSNRIANLSWFLYPILLAYPLLNFPVFKKNHSQKTAWILLAQFAFTTLMWLRG